MNSCMRLLSPVAPPHGAVNSLGMVGKGEQHPKHHQQQGRRQAATAATPPQHAAMAPIPPPTAATRQALLSAAADDLQPLLQLEQRAARSTVVVAGVTAHAPLIGSAKLARFVGAGNALISATFMLLLLLLLLACFILQARWT